MNNFPCKDCLVKTCCTAHCDKLIQDGKTMALYLLIYKTCPDCGSSRLEISPERQVLLCQECHKAFEQRVKVEFKETLIGSSSSSSPSISPSLSTSPNLIITPGPQHKYGTTIITNISSYNEIKTPSPKEKKAKIEAVKEPPPSRRHYITFRRKSYRYAKSIMKQFDRNIQENLIKTIQKIDIAPLAPDWIMKHRNLFIKDPYEKNGEDSSIQIVT